MIFGLRPIIEAIEAGKQLEKVYLKKGADGVLLNELAELCRSKRIHVQWVPIEKLNYLTRNGNHQGAVALNMSTCTTCWPGFRRTKRRWSSFSTG